MNVSFMGVSASCLPAVCMLVIGRGPSVFVVVDVQSFCMVGSGGILNRSGPLPLGNKLIVWDIKMIVWLKFYKCSKQGRKEYTCTMGMAMSGTYHHPE